MTRARSGKVVIRDRKRLRRLTKGFRLSRHNLYRQSLVTLMRGRVYAFRDRRVRKRTFRRLWITRISAACRMRDLRYSQLIRGLQGALVELDLPAFLVREEARDEVAGCERLTGVAGLRWCGRHRFFGWDRAFRAIALQWALIRW